jgi:hypothetical protein
MELIANRTRLYFIYVIMGVAGAGELSSEFDYTDDYVVDDYVTTCSRSTDSEYLLGIAM